MSAVQPKLIIHGGAGLSLQGKGGVDSLRQSLYQILEPLYALLRSGAAAQAVVVRGCQLLEDNPRFNAGTGSVLQSDGQIRLSASLMTGAQQRFSGVINVSRVKNPIDLAESLQAADDRVLSDYGALDLARELQIPVHDPITKLRFEEWMQERESNFSRAMANVVARDPLPDRVASEAGRGTIGVVALDQQGQIAAGTSTGGKGFERIGRVSDSCMPAGNYASSIAGISCTGIGEDIIDECLAARIVVRVTDGMTLHTAFEKSFQEAAQRQRDFGAIGIDAQGHIAWGKTSQVLLAAYHNGDRPGDTLELETTVTVGVTQ